MLPTNEEMGLNPLSNVYEGQDLVGRLRATWPDSFATGTLDQCHLCSAIDVLRWMASIQIEELHISKLELSNELLSLSLADFPASADTEKKDKISAALSTINYRYFTGVEQDGKTLNLFDILEGSMMIKTFWSEPRNLLYKTPVWAECAGTINYMHRPIEAIAHEGLIFIEDPDELATAVEKKLGTFKLPDQDIKLFNSLTPPDFIRVRWDNTKWLAQNNGKSAFRSLHAFELSVRMARIEREALDYPEVTVGYRLICMAKISPPGEEPLGIHMYTCDGGFFQLQLRTRSQNWSCSDPGCYYLVYYKSDRVQNLVLERADPMPDIGLVRQKVPPITKVNTNKDQQPHSDSKQPPAHTNAAPEVEKRSQSATTDTRLRHSPSSKKVPTGPSSESLGRHRSYTPKASATQCPSKHTIPPTGPRRQPSEATSPMEDGEVREDKQLDMPPLSLPQKPSHGKRGKEDRYRPYHPYGK
ncbi:hypothetical protein F4819DRAFT_466874 [Hypoxylon fuscum]|nr:hypothetical protein F4819DRAFT_466874 [Hypoxylon fuscum]